METIRANWYDYPHLYDIAFGWDPSVEVDFLEEAFRRFSGRPVRTVFEPFVGAGRIAIELARRGYEVSGVDLSPAAIDFARERTAERSLAVRLDVQNVAQWRTERPYDAIVALIDSFRLLKSERDAASAVRAFHAGLKPGGVLVIGIDVGAKPVEVTDEEHWTLERAGVVVETAVFDLRKPGKTAGTTVVRSVLHVTEPDREYEIITDEEMRKYTLKTFLNLLRENGPFGLKALCDRDYDFARPARSPDLQDDIVAVFQRE